MGSDYAFLVTVYHAQVKQVQKFAVEVPYDEAISTAAEDEEGIADMVAFFFEDDNQLKWHKLLESQLKYEGDIIAVEAISGVVK